MIVTNKTQEVIEEFGADLVYEVIEIVSMSDADGAYTMFEDMGMVVSLLDHRGSQSDQDDYQLITSENVSKNRINDLVAEIQEFSKKYATE